MHRRATGNSKTPCKLSRYWSQHRRCVGNSIRWIFRTMGDRIPNMGTARCACDLVVRHGPNCDRLNRGLKENLLRTKALALMLSLTVCMAFGSAALAIDSPHAPTLKIGDPAPAI